MDSASMAHANLKDSMMLDSALNGDITPQQAIANAAQGIGSNSNNLYSTAGRNAMTELANAGPGKLNQWLQTKAAQGINTGVKGGLIGTLGHTLGGALGDPGLGAILGAEQGITKNAGGIGGFLVNPAANRLPIASNASARRAIKAARAAVSSGQPATAAMYQGYPWIRKAAQTGLMSEAAAGNV